LRHGGDPDPRRGGRQTAEPRARELGRRAHTHRQPDQSLPRRRPGATLARLGIRGFKPTLRTAPEQLDRLRTPEGTPLPPNTLAELRREMARLRLLAEQIREIEAARCERLQLHPDEGTHPMVRLLAQIIGVGIETADMLVQEVLSRNSATAGRWHGTAG
jgi:transposase